MKSHSLRILDREMAEATDPRDRDPFSRSRLRLLKSFVRGDPSTQERPDMRELEALGKPHSDSQPVSQYSHRRQLSWSQATPTGSPSLKSVMPGPTAATTPATSCPGA